MNDFDESNRVTNDRISRVKFDYIKFKRNKIRLFVDIVMKITMKIFLM